MSGSVGLDFGLKASDADLDSSWSYNYRIVEFFRRDSVVYFFEGLNILISTIRSYVTESQAASCMHFQSQNRRFKVFESGYWKDFQN